MVFLIKEVSNGKNGLTAFKTCIKFELVKTIIILSLTVYSIFFISYPRKMESLKKKNLLKIRKTNIIYLLKIFYKYTMSNFLNLIKEIRKIPCSTFHT